MLRITIFGIASILISAIIGIGGFYIASGVWKRTAWGKKILGRRKRSPLRESMLRHPGQSLSEALQDNNLDIMSSSLAIVLIPLMIAMILTLLTGGKGGAMSVIILAAISCIACTPSFVRVRGLARKRRDLRLGLDGELATGEQLNQLMYHGYHVFHDFPADKFNVDHVVIGATGVFAVETKARAKPDSTVKDGFKVFVHGSTLKFPGYDNCDYIGQAKDRAIWLSDFLSKRVGKPIYAQPVLALPGWLVDRSSNNNNSVAVINHKEIFRLLSSKEATLDKQTIEQIRFQVDKACRSIEPYVPW